jgi:hypothetical protein
MRLWFFARSHITREAVETRGVFSEDLRRVQG